MLRLVVASASLALAAVPAAADPVYFGLGDSITFGETDLDYVPSLGDRGYVDDFADILAARNGGVRPVVINLGIDGETAESFQDGTGRTQPVVGRTDPILAGQNLNYEGRTSTPQAALFAEKVAEQRAAGNSIDTISMTLGFNEVAALAALPNGVDIIPSTLAAYETNYRTVLAQVRGLAPEADLYLLNYFNPFPGDPTGANPATPIFAAAGPQLNAIILDLSREFDAAYVDTFTPFLGREAELTFIDEQPAGYVHPDPFGGVEPVGNVHPTEEGYAVIAQQLANAQVPVPEPAMLGLLGLGVLGIAGLRRRVVEREAAPHHPSHYKSLSSRA